MRRGYLVVAVTFLVVTGLAAGFAQTTPAYAEVTDSAGFAEALLPEIGWRQAVQGRRLDAGSVATTWVEAFMTIRYGDAQAALSPLTHVAVTSLGPGEIGLELTSGHLEITCETMAVSVVVSPNGVDTIIIRVGPEPASVSIGDQLTVTTGRARIHYDNGRELSVDAGETIPLHQIKRGPVFSGP